MGQEKRINVTVRGEERAPAESYFAEATDIQAKGPPHSDEFGAILILLHGAGSVGEWTKEIKHYSDLSENPIKIEPLYIGRIPRIETTIFDNVDRYVTSLGEYISNVYNRNPGKNISIACHSFGSYILSKCREFPEGFRFEKVFLLGSIVKRDDVIFLRGMSGEIICDTTTHDYISCCLEAYAQARFERTSVIGINNGIGVINRQFKGGHKHTIKIPHFRDHIFPYILPGSRIEIPRDRFRIWHSDRICENLRFFVPLFLIIFVISLTIFHAEAVHFLSNFIEKMAYLLAFPFKML